MYNSNINNINQGDKLRIALTTIDGQTVAAYLIMEHGVNKTIHTNIAQQKQA